MTDFFRIGDISLIAITILYCQCCLLPFLADLLFDRKH